MFAISMQHILYHCNTYNINANTVEPVQDGHCVKQPPLYNGHLELAHR